MRRRLTREGGALLEREQRPFLARLRDRDDDLVHQLRGARDDVEVTVGDGIERARIDCRRHFLLLFSSLDRRTSPAMPLPALASSSKRTAPALPERTRTTPRDSSASSESSSVGDST